MNVAGVLARLRRLDPLPAVIVAVCLVVWGVRGFGAALTRDGALYLYAGQLVASGEAPYEGVLNRSGPLSHLLPGVGVALGRLTGTGDAVGAKAFYLALLLAAPALVYLIARDVYGSRLAGVAAAAALLSIRIVGTTWATGPEAKLPMMVGLVATLLLLVRRRWLWAGVATALATLTWQPVLFTLAPAAAVMLLTQRGGLRRRALAVAWYAAGGFATLAVTLIYFWLAGALDVFVEAFWTVNREYTDQTGGFDRPFAVIGHLRAGLGWSFYPFALGCMLSVALGIAAVKVRHTSPRRASASLAFAVATVTSALWIGMAFNRAPDALTLYPLAALGLGGGVGVLAHLVGRTEAKLPRRLLIGAIACWVAVCAAITLDTSLTRRGTDNIAGQRAMAVAPFRHLPDDVTVYSFEAPQALALTGTESISRYILFGHGLFGYVDATWPGGLPGYAGWLIQEEPDVLFVSGRQPSDSIRHLFRHYVKVSGGPEMGEHPEWRTYVHEDVDPAILEAITEDIVAARMARGDA